MQHGKLNTLAVFFLCFTFLNLPAQYLKIIETNGTITNIQVSEIKKLTFTEGKIIIHEIDKTNDYVLNEVKHIRFENIIDKINRSIFNESIIIYPNPVVDVLKIDLFDNDASATINIISLEGKLLQSIKTNGNKNITINLSRLPEGLYLCQYKSKIKTKTFKLVKQ